MWVYLLRTIKKIGGQHLNLRMYNLHNHSTFWDFLNFSPDTASYIQKLEKEREAKEKGEVKDNRSFLAKYVSNNITFHELLMFNISF